MNKDLRSFLAEAERLGPDFFLRITKPVDVNYEPCVIQQKLAAQGRYPVLRFDAVRGSGIPLVTNLFGDYAMLGLALGIAPGRPKREILDTFRKRLESPIATTTVSRSQAPVKEVILKGQDIDLGRLPILKHAELNGGKYITIGFLIVRDPETGVLSFEASVFETVKKLVPSVQAVYMPPSGSCVFTAYVQIKKRVPGEGKSAGLAAIAAEPNLKIAIVLDDDIDIYNEEQVLWAIATQCEADRDISIIPHAMGAHLNPSAYGERRTDKGPMNTKLIIDATRPATLPFAERIRPPKEAWERVRLEDYLPPR